MAVNCEKVVDDLFAAWTRLDIEGIMSHFAEDAVWDNVPMSPAKGQAAIREMTNGFLKDSSAFSAKILKSVHVDNTVFNERVDTITMKNGKSAAIPVAGCLNSTTRARLKSGAITSISAPSPSKSPRPYISDG
jgi:limonene-1,2-epoxide hydrolase